MARRVAQIVVLGLSVLAAGCLNFEEQTVTYRYDEASDTLRLFLDYHGIFGDHGLPDALTRSEVEQLDSVITTERSFFFANWIWELSRPQLNDRLERFDERSFEERTPLAVATAALERQLLAALHVENGPVYFDSRHRLSAVQQVTLTHVTPLIAAANETIAEQYREEATKPDGQARDRELYRRALDQHREFIARHGHAFLVRLPETREEFDASTEDFAKLRDGGIGVSFANGATTLQIGSPDDVATAITLPVSETEYIPNAVESVKTRMTILDGFNASEAARKFLSAAASDEPITVELRNRVKPGGTVVVTDRNGVQTEGRFVRLSPQELVMQVDGKERAIRSSRIGRVEKRDGLWNGMLIGAIPSALVGGAAAGASCSPHCGRDVSLGMLAFGAMGAGVGAFVDSRIRGYSSLAGPPLASANALGVPAPVASVDQLWRRVRQGDTIDVVTVDGEKVAGRFVNVSSSRLTLMVSGGQREIASTDIRRVTRRGNRYRSGALWGGTIAAATAALGSATCSGGGCGNALFVAMFAGSAGALWGAAIGAVIPRHPMVYESRSLSSVRVVPMMGRGRAGVAVSATF